MSYSRSTTRLARRPLAIVLALAVAIGVASFQAPQSAEALSGSSFDPGYIISDSQFYSNDAMSEAEIQAFLNSKVATCGNANCLKNLRVDTFSRAADRTLCAAYQGATQESAARVIFKVQQACGISAKVLLVTLQKEQSLVTASAPSSSKLGRAMGYGCPDNNGGVCDANYYGLYNQLYSAAWQFKRYSYSSGYYYHPGPPLPIAFHPNSSCGNVGIAIRNNATAALYNYTPYVPNAAALGNLGGTGDSCSSYGNRNFWAYYTNWFGSTTSVVPDVEVVRITGIDRFDTSAQLSIARGTSSANTVYVANGQNFPDALSAAPAAIMNDAPLLLVAPTWMSPSVRAELVRLNPERIVVLGGEDSVSSEVFNDLATLASTIVRYTGVDRYGTSRILAEATFPLGSTTLAYISTGEGFADALSASVAAGAQRAPIILVPGSSPTLDQPTLDTLALLGVTRVIITGGPTTVSPGIEATLRSVSGLTVERITGLNRFETASALNRDYFTSSSTVVLTSGRKFPDALAGAALAGSIGAALYLSEPGCLYRQTAQDIIDLGATKVIVLGGPDTLAASVESFYNCD